MSGSITWIDALRRRIIDWAFAPLLSAKSVVSPHPYPLLWGVGGRGTSVKFQEPGVKCHVSGGRVWEIIKK